ncbi:hypothetical protein, partial [Salmonella sp. s51090]|uniref:hypothetical protein n=1 Tax=Salmonella sp. s51090 TaxID=3159651 RepID=UPI00397ECF24
MITLAVVAVFAATQAAPTTEKAKARNFISENYNATESIPEGDANIDQTSDDSTNIADKLEDRDDKDD